MSNGSINGNATNNLKGNSAIPPMRSYEEDRNTTSQDVYVPHPTFDRLATDSTSTYTTSNGVPVPHPYQVQRAGLDGPLLLQDFHLIDLLSHFDRERSVFPPSSSCILLTF